MRKISHLFKRAEADRKASPASLKIEPEHDTVELDITDLDHVAGGGGKVGVSSNPVED